MNHTPNLCNLATILVAFSTATLALPGAALAGQIANGDFDNGLAGWTVNNDTKEDGPDTLSQVVATTRNTTSFGGDASSANLSVSDVANYAGGPSFVKTRFVLSQRVEDIEGLSLQFSHGRLMYDISAVTTGVVSVSASVEVRTALSSSASSVVAEKKPGSFGPEQHQTAAPLFSPLEFHPQLPCHIGTGIGNDDPIPMDDMVVDLGAAGFSVGDDVVVSFVVTALVDADSFCDSAYSLFEIYIDEVEITAP